MAVGTFHPFDVIVNAELHLLMMALVLFIYF